jgi:hypothetical protein
MDIMEIFRKEGEQLFWRRIDDRRISERPSGEPIGADEAYLQVRLAEMYLGRTRTLWRKFSPLVHAFIARDNGEELHAVAGPGQLQELGEHNLDRVIVLNFRLAGPIPYKGGEVRLLTGLYSVPREDAAAALVSTVGALAGVAGPSAVAASEIVNLVKSGVDSILGLGTTKLRLGINDTFGGANGLRSGFHVGIGAPEAQVPLRELWVREGRLVQGNSLALADPYTGNDYFVLYLERLARRDDWPGLPGVVEFDEQFKKVLKGSGTVEAKRAELAAQWPSFREALVTSPFLTRFDAGQIANDVAVDLKKRLDAMETDNPFIETRGWGSDQVERQRPEEVDFAGVPAASAGDPDEGERALADPGLST